MNLSDRFKVNHEVIHETIDDEVIIVNLVSGIYYSLDKTGTVIWNYIERNESIGEMINNINSNYDCNLEELKNTLSELLTALKDEKLIILNQENFTKGVVEAKTQVENTPSKQKKKFEKPKLGKYNDMQELLLLDPIHDVDEMGWPNPKKQQD
ncbi:MAG: PqqD family protein [Thermodesulfobacteriota bacterium]